MNRAMVAKKTLAFRLFFKRILHEKTERKQVSVTQRVNHARRQNIEVLMNTERFIPAEYDLLQKYVIICFRMQYGLTYRQARVFAFEYALNIPKYEIPEYWTLNNIAGLFRHQNCMKRHPKLSLRRPENTRLGRATAFNKHNANDFFTNYLNVSETTNLLLIEF